MNSRPTRTLERSPPPTRPENSDHIPYIIIGGFIVLSLIAMIIMWNGYRRSYAVMAVKEQLSREAYEEAIPHLLFLIEKSPKSWNWHRQLADCYVSVNQPESALENYRKAKQLNEKLDVEVKIAICQYRLGLTEEAMKKFQQILKRDPKNPAANFHLAVESYAARRYGDAARYFQLTAGEEKWNKQSEPYRVKMAQQVLGDLAQPTEGQTPSG